MKTNRVRHFFYTYFTYTRGEKNAALVLCSILFVLQIVLWYKHYYLKPQEYILSQAEQIAADGISKPKYEKKNFSSSSKINSEIVLSMFDPNTTDSSGYVALGMSPRQASSLLKYRDRIGGFKNKEEVRAVRVLNAALFERWEPFIALSHLPEKKAENNFIKKEKKQNWILVDLNSADTSELKDLPFIGSGRAKSIVNYRERLGGFYSIEQLKELRSIPDSVYAIIYPKVKLGSGPYKKLNINSLSADSLRHPYINKQLARLIVAYREQHGLFKSSSDLRNLPLVDEEILRKLAAYLILN